MLKSLPKRVLPLGAGALVRDGAENLPHLPGPMQRAYLPTTSCEPVPHHVVQSLLRDAPILPPEPCRKVSPRGRRSHRGIARVWCPRPRAFRQIWHESLLELHVLWLFAIRPDFHDAREQVGPVTLQGILRDTSSMRKPRSVTGDHYFDLVVTLSNEKRVAYVIKPAAKADAAFRATECLRSQNLDPAVADQAMLITDTDFRTVDAVNAGRLLAEDRFDDPDADAAVLEFVSKCMEPRMIFQIVEATGYGARAYSAALRHIRWRRLQVLSPGIVDMFSMVRGSNHE